MAWLTFWHNASSARTRPRFPSAAGKSMGSVTDRNPWLVMWRSLAVSSLLRMGDGMVICWQLSGSGLSRFRSGPTVLSIEVTSSSRMASRGGFVTWAKSCLK